MRRASASLRSGTARRARSDLCRRQDRLEPSLHLSFEFKRIQAFKPLSQLPSLSTGQPWRARQPLIRRLRRLVTCTNDQFMRLI
jgi:hypothetical protein